MLQKPDITRFSTTARESSYTFRIHVTRLMRPGTQHANAKHGGNVRADGEPDKPKNDAGMINGMRMMRSVNTRSEAKTWLHEMTVKLKTQGRTAMTLTDRQRLDVIRATEIRAPPSSAPKGQTPSRLPTQQSRGVWRRILRPSCRHGSDFGLRALCRRTKQCICICTVY